MFEEIPFCPQDYYFYRMNRHHRQLLVVFRNDKYNITTLKAQSTFSKRHDIVSDISCFSEDNTETT